ncbi:ABC transporter permease [Agrobacterium radiobacter]|uniref:Peptide/nickel transport system permease protein n=2 Tax=Agrobacterium tumefaciens complex TaxID=1183400 RepID=A0ABR6J8M6_AGRRD|nr:MULTISPECIES: ABC transporter permease [Agrobacterium tumefaciens complex]MCP2137451.1 peptide/nickel transport system permease protein [Rhizobium sp. SLBN-94]TGE79554.1 ABC transporter permease [Rhizobium sp. SEMIA 439]KAA1234277.1 ABC transporter permease [Agrobacterium tumefaciens]MBB4282031.1 peptide/nickel transport system permease protein [Agrobacterium radiobacter]MBB4319369.1 peptide/nickel transport system permease protein [Agrobacterium radiobacter]
MKRATTLLKRRAVSAIPVLLIVLVFTFVLLENASGDAVDAYLVSIGGGDAGLRDVLREQYGLNGSVLARFWLYASSVLRFDLGWSLAFDRPVLGLILERLPNTLLLMGSATTLAFILGTALGIVAGARPGGLTDRVLSTLSLALYATPGFWLGLVLAIVFAVQLKWLPTSGIETIASGKQGFARALDIGRHLVLPVASLGLIYLALFLRVTRTAMAAVWPLDFVLFARSKGLSKRRIVLRHVARNAALPLVTVLGLQAATMLGGSVVIESVFAIPGFGRLAQEAVSGRDTPLLMGIILTSAVFVILVNLAVDILYAVLDPRIGSGERQA